MPTYLFICPDCRLTASFEAPFGEAPNNVICPACERQGLDRTMGRDFRAEGKRISAGFFWDPSRTVVDQRPKHLRGLGPHNKEVIEYNRRLTVEGPDWGPSHSSLGLATPNAAPTTGGPETDGPSSPATPGDPSPGD